MSKHGGNLRKLREQAGRDVIDFSASINPYGAPDWMHEEFMANVDACSHYPDIDCHDLIEAASREFDVAGENIVACNGISEALAFLSMCGQYQRAVVPAPGYSDYVPFCRNNGLDIEYYALDSRDHFSYPPVETLINLCKSGDLLFICTPDNPVGSVVDIDYIKTVADACPQTTVVVDTAYYDFLHDGKGNPAGSRQWVTKMPENVVVLWSLTKFYSIAGLRLGLVFADGKICDCLRQRLPSWSVNTLAQKVGTRALQDQEFYEQSRKTSAQLYTNFYQSLCEIPGLDVCPSKCNFIACRISDNRFTAAELFEKLLHKGVAIRDCANIKGMDAYYFRVAVRTEKENALLLDLLRGEFGQVQSVALNKNSKPKKPALMFLGCSSNAGKSVLAAALCRIMKQDGIRVAPFKAQNMALNSAVTVDGGEIGRAQELQAQAAGVEPQVRFNPLLLKPTGSTGSQVVLNGKVLGNFKVREYYAKKDELFTEVKAAYDSLCEDFDAVVLEGAGSPGEVNLKRNDVVNLRMAEYAQATSLLVGDIDRGGVYASFIGHWQTFSKAERELVQGFVVNRFRGDVSLLSAAHDYVKGFTGRDVWGVVPHLADLNLPQEDSVTLEQNFAPLQNKRMDALDVALIAVPHMANYTDFDALKNEPDVRLRLVRSGGELGRPDLLLLPGSKNVPGDVAYMKQSGQFDAVLEYEKHGGYIAGICGGLQMLGKSLSDPYCIEDEQGGEHECLGIMPLTTRMEKGKILTRVSGVHLPSGLQVIGFEMHHGQSDFDGMTPCVKLDNGQILGVGDERVWATYLHGVFDADEFRRYYIDRIRIARGLSPVGKILYRHNCEQSLDRLADAVRAALPVERIYNAMGLR